MIMQEQGGYKFMRKWISVKDRSPPNESIIVFGTCRMPHVSIFDYEEHCHTECCYENGRHFTGESIEFTHWMPLPKPPKDAV